MPTVSLQDAIGTPPAGATPAGNKMRTPDEVNGIIQQMQQSADFSADDSTMDQMRTDLSNGADVNMPGLVDPATTKAHSVKKVSLADAFGSEESQDTKHGKLFNATILPVLEASGKIKDYINAPPVETTPGRMLTPQEQEAAEKTGNGPSPLALFFGTEGPGKPTFLGPQAKELPPGYGQPSQDEVENSKATGLVDTLKSKNVIREILNESLPANMVKSVANAPFQNKLKADEIKSFLDNRKVLDNPDTSTPDQLKSAKEYFDDLKGKLPKDLHGQFDDMVASVKSDPGKFVGNLIHGLLTDPELAYIPGASAARLGRGVEAAGAAAKLGRVAANVGITGAEGGAINAAIDYAHQSATGTGGINPDELKMAVAQGAVMGGTLGAILHRGVKAKVANLDAAKLDGTLKDILKDQAAYDATIEAAVSGDKSVPVDLQQKINESLGITSKTDKEAYLKKRRTDVRDAFKTQGEYADYLEFKANEAADLHERYQKQQADISKRRSAEQAKQNEVEQAYAQTAEERRAQYQKDYEEAVKQKDAADLTDTHAQALAEDNMRNAQDKIDAEDAMLAAHSDDLPAVKQAMAKIQRRNPSFKVRGEIDPELLARFGVTAAGAAGGAYLAGPDHRKAGGLVGALAGLLVPAGGSIGRGIGGRERGVIGGRSAETAHLGRLDAAQQLESMGRDSVVDPAQIKKDIYYQTGWYRGRDGKWKFEIPDTDAHVNSDVIRRIRDGGSTQVKNVLNHPELWKAYPKIGDISIRFEDMPKNAKGHYDPGKQEIVLNKKAEAYTGKGKAGSLPGVLLHELNHIIQFSEGHARGGSLDEFLKKDPKYKELVAQLQDAKATDNFDVIGSIVPEINKIKQAAFEKYRKLSGEVESRNVQTRFAMDDVRRQKTFPETTEDTPAGDQIVRFGKQQMLSEESPKELPDPNSLRDNYRKKLSNYSRNVYHETNGERALNIIPGSNVRTIPDSIYVSNTPDLALGQGNNKGILVEFDASMIEGQISKRKPGWEHAWKNGAAEFTTSNFLTQSDYQKAVTAVTVKPDAIMSSVNKAQIKNAIDMMKRHGWEQIENKDGSVTYRKPNERIAKSEEKDINEKSVADHLAESGHLTPDSTLRGVVLKEAKLPDEAAVISRAQKGDQKAYAALYKQYFPRLERSVRSFMKSTRNKTNVDAEDIAQQAFIQAFKNIDKFEGNSQFYTWLYRIAQNEGLQALRAGDSRIKTTSMFNDLNDQGAGSARAGHITEGDSSPVKGSVEIASATHDTPEANARAGEVQHQLEYAFSKLPDIQRKIVTGIELEGKEPAQLAQELNISDAALRKYLQRGRESIAASLEKGLGARKIVSKNQGGSIDPDLLKRLAIGGAGAATGAYINKKHPLWGAALGAGIFLLAGKGGKNLWSDVDHVAGVMSTRIKNKSEAIHFRAKEYYRVRNTVTHDLINAGHPFLSRVNKLPPAIGDVIQRSILSGNRAVTDKLLDAVGDPELTGSWKLIKKVVDGLGTELSDAGMIKKTVEDYFPRIVQDKEGLFKAMGKEQSDAVKQLLDQANRESLRSTGNPLSQADESEVINKAIAAFLYSKAPDSVRAGYSHARRFKEIPEEYQKYYANLAESFHSYVRTAVKNIEMAKFFGKDLVNKEEGGVTFPDVDKSIGKYVEQELRDGKITTDDVAEVSRMLRSSFVNFERGGNKTIQSAKNITMAGYLGNPLSAAMQITTPIVTTYLQGLKPTLEATVKKLTGRSEVNAKDFGLADHMSEEFVGTTRSAKFLRDALKWGSFKFSDLFDKDIKLNSAIIKARDLARTPAGVKKLEDKYGQAFADRFPDLVKELKEKRVGENTKALAYQELSRSDPIDPLEFSQFYADNPNGRNLLALKSYMMKQVDLIRRDAYNEIKTGNRAKGIKNLAALSLVLGVSGMAGQDLQDVMLGRPIKFRISDIPLNMLKTFGWSEYASRKATGSAIPTRKNPEGTSKAKGQLFQTVGEVLAPPIPYQAMDDLWNRDPRAVAMIPVVGRFLAEYYKNKNKTKAQRTKERNQL